MSAGLGLAVLICALAAGSTFAAERPSPEKPNRLGEHYLRAEYRYQIPNVTLRDRHDRPVDLQSVLADGRPVLLQFIFTSCETVCPMLTAVTAQAQDRLRALAPSTRIVSVSLDPEYDTPNRMAAYATKFGAKGDWRFLTGTWDAISRTLTAFDAMYPGHNKMYHKPYTFMRPAYSATWVRLTGLMSAAQLVAEYRGVLADGATQRHLASPQLSTAQEH